MPETALLFIHALTGLHPGSGTALGVVDLPVARERHTQWPIIPGSTLKGVLRDQCRPQEKGERAESKNQDRWLAVFGPETSNAADHAGALSLTDARILAFPVRSMKGVFAWVTCAAVLERLNRDLGLVHNAVTIEAVPVVAPSKAACSATSPLLIDGDNLILEEFDFTRVAEAQDIAEWIAGHTVADAATSNRIKSHLVILHDDDFDHFVRHATEVTARIGLDSESKTVKKGALFYQEFLPPETLFYSLVLPEISLRKNTPMTAKEIRQYIRDHMPAYLQIGGNETIGKGLCAVRLVEGKEANQ